MAAPIGNRFWEARSSHGVRPKFETPEHLWSACCEYFQWNADNPLYEEKGFAFQGIVTKEKFAKIRAMTIEGLCQFIDVETSTWREWRQTRKDLSAVITRVDEIIRRQKFEGAAADLLNANIIARDLGLSDKAEITGKDGKDLIPPANDLEVARRVAFLFQKAMIQAGGDQD